MGRVIDETGNRYGRWTVLYRAGTDKYNRATWHCRCDCGSEKDVAGLMLRNGRSKSCGCINKDRMAAINNSHITHKVEIGDRFGHLVVINIDSHNKVLCKCDCGQYKKTTRPALYGGHVTTCGCKMGYKQYNFIDEKNNKYGLLTVIEEAGRDSDNRVLWKCKCECGNETIVSGKSLRNGNTRSCGCLKSKGELKIKNILIEHKLNFVSQKTFNNLHSNKGYPLFFDFYLSDYNILIEYQGEQHFHYANNVGWNNEENFKETQLRDNLKREYCQKNNIPLIEIPYTDYEKLDWEYLKEKCNL